MKLKDTKPSYPAFFHNIHKGIADITFPATKDEILKKIGDREIFVDWDSKLALKVLIEPIEQKKFSCCSDFYSMMIAAM